LTKTKSLEDELLCTINENLIWFRKKTSTLLQTLVMDFVTCT